jgi:hypothetical protein
MATTRSQTNSEFESIAITDASGLVIGLDVAQLAVADVANLTIPGGTAGQLLSTDGNGALSWTTAGGATVQVATQASETFTAASQQTVFTLARVPSGTVSGSINGVTAAATAFTVVGTTVTYVAAQNGAYLLKDGDRITLSYLYGATSATSLGGLADVTFISPPTNGEVLAYDVGSSSWINSTGSTTYGTLANGTSNVTVVNSGNVTVAVAGTANVARFASTGVTVSNLTVTGTSATLGDIAGVQIAGGTSGQAIQSLGGGDLAFVNPSRLVTYAYCATTLTFAANFVPTLVRYAEKLYDPQALYDVVTGRFQPKVAGWYQIAASASVYVNNTSEQGLILKHSVDGNFGQTSSFGLIGATVVGAAYFNGTTDYAWAEVVMASAGTRGQFRGSASFTATHLGL